MAVNFELCKRKAPKRLKSILCSVVPVMNVFNEGLCTDTVHDECRPPFPRAQVSTGLITERLSPLLSST